MLTAIHVQFQLRESIALIVPQSYAPYFLVESGFGQNILDLSIELLKEITYGPLNNI